MVITIPGVIPPHIADRIVSEIAPLAWHAGDTPNEEYKAIKRNQELKEKDSPVAERHLIAIMRATMGSREFRDKVFPYKVKTPQFNRYTGGEQFHPHSDMWSMGTPEIRTDVSMTVFLSAPDSYDGGELALHYATGEVRAIKEPQGTVVCYPSEVIHHVNPVTRGTRYAAVTWVQSYVRAQAQRNVLTELLGATQRIKAAEGVSETYTSVLSVYNNLFRMWAEL